jgi:hypothetical protein
LNVTVVEHRQTSWCGWIVGVVALTGVGLGVYRLSLGPKRAALVHTATLDEWSARILEVGYWSEERREWTGPTTFEIELMGPDKSVQRISTNIQDLERAISLTTQKLQQASSPPVDGWSSVKRPDYT